MTGLRFVPVHTDDELAQPLLAELAVEYATRYDSTEEFVARWLRSHPAGTFGPPDGGMLIGVLDGKPVTGGAFCCLALDSRVMAQNPLHLGVALDGYGWHPQAWRHTLAADPAAAPVTSGRHWAQLAATAERGLLDFLTVDDSFSAQPGRREEIDPRRLAGRADAVLVAARIAPLTHDIGLIPVATVTHTEPFHVSKAIATLDFISHGRAGWQARVSPAAHEAAAFGRRSAPGADDLFDEAADFVEVVRRLWDSWEDDAVIRDVGTGRYVDRAKLHYIDFTGTRFSVKARRSPRGRRRGNR